MERPQPRQGLSQGVRPARTRPSDRAGPGAVDNSPAIGPGRASGLSAEGA
jgi:hypothetical protein